MPAIVTLRDRLCRSGWVRRGLAFSAFVGAGLGGAVIAKSGADRLDDTARAGVLRADVSVNVGRVAVGRPVSAGFVGLSIEYPAVTAYAGTDPSAINPCSSNWFATSLRTNTRCFGSVATAPTARGGR